MRAMILAAGRGTRLLPLSALRPKSAMPVRGIPLVAYTLEWLAAEGVSEVALNLHHLPDAIREAALAHRPRGLELHFSLEPQLLGTGGGIRRMASFLRESDPSLVIAGDMLLDLELAPWVARHRERGAGATLLLRDDPRGDRFGTIGVDGDGRVRRIPRRLDLDGETRKGLYMSVTLFSPRAFDWMPDAEAFGHLDAWLGPRLLEHPSDVRGECLNPQTCRWEPVGTPDEYLRVNLEPVPLRYFDAEARAARLGTRFGPGLVIGAGARVEPGARLARAVVWDGEHVPGNLEASDGVFAGGRFHPCRGRGAVG